MADLSQLTVKQRVEAMILAAQTEHGAVVSINQSNRTMEQAQQFHVCHMFLHNFFRRLRPKNVAADGRTIAWEHLQDPAISWALIPNPESLFLRTKSNEAARRETAGGVARWAKGFEPDKAATVRCMTTFLRVARVSSMAAPGLDGCGEPCGCGGNRSKHISGAACDVSGMETLGQAILDGSSPFKSADEALDHFLAEYSLWRPMAHLPGKAREAWHLEALPPHHAHHAPKRHPHGHGGVHPPHAPAHAPPHLKTAHPHQTQKTHSVHPKHGHHPNHSTHVQHDPRLHVRLHSDRLNHHHGC